MLRPKLVRCSLGSGVSITVMGVHTADAYHFRDRTYAVTAVGAASAADGGADSSDLSSPTAIRKRVMRAGARETRETFRAKRGKHFRASNKRGKGCTSK